MAAARPAALRALAACIARSLRHSRRRLCALDQARFLDPLAEVLDDIHGTIEAYKAKDASCSRLDAAPVAVQGALPLLGTLAVRGDFRPPSLSPAASTSSTSSLSAPTSTATTTSSCSSATPSSAAASLDESINGKLDLVLEGLALLLPHSDPGRARVTNLLQPTTFDLFGDDVSEAGASSALHPRAFRDMEAQTESDAACKHLRDNEAQTEQPEQEQEAEVRRKMLQRIRQQDDELQVLRAELRELKQMLPGLLAQLAKLEEKM